MLRAEIHQRLRLLRRLPAVVPDARPSDGTKVQNRQRAIPRITLEDGREVLTPRGPHWRVDRPVDFFWPEFPRVLEAWTRKSPTPPPNPMDRASKPTRRSAIESNRALLEQVFRRSLLTDCVFLDLETCGLAGAPIFLAGTIRPAQSDVTQSDVTQSDVTQSDVTQSDATQSDALSEGQKLHVTQFWARTYAEEEAILWTLHDALEKCAMVITFNGKSFDWPQVCGRSHRYRALLPRREPRWLHFDALHWARRKYRGLLPDCRLQTLEAMVCRRARNPDEDVPGWLIPETYKQYVFSGKTDGVNRIAQHNAMDLVTLLHLLIL